MADLIPLFQRIQAVQDQLKTELCIQVVSIHFTLPFILTYPNPIKPDDDFVLAFTRNKGFVVYRNGEYFGALGELNSFIRSYVILEIPKFIDALREAQTILRLHVEPRLAQVVTECEIRTGVAAGMV